MSKATKCDRCGDYYTENNKNNITTSILHTGSYNTFYDLCNKCTAEFTAWWNTVKKVDEK